ncbi:ATP-binding protein [Roseiterribacter gracilis]
MLGIDQASLGGTGLELTLQAIGALARQVSLLAISAVAYAWLLQTWRRSGAWLALLLATVLMSVLVTLTLLNPVQLATVGQLDVRDVIVSFATLDLPLLPSLVVTAVAMAVRGGFGDAAAGAGVANIALTFLLARALRYAIDRGKLTRGPRIYLFIAVTQWPVFVVPSVLMIPGRTLSQMLGDGSLLVMAVLGVVTIAFGWVSDFIARQADKDLTIEENAISLRHILDGSTQGVLIHDGLKPIFANETFARIYGYASAEAVIQAGTIAPLVVTQSGRPPSDEMLWLQTDPRGVPTFMGDRRARRVDGSTIWIDAEIRLTMWRGSRAIQTTVVDVTDAHRAADLLQQRREMLAKHQDALLELLRLRFDGSQSFAAITEAALPLLHAGMGGSRTSISLSDHAAGLYECLGYYEPGAGMSPGDLVLRWSDLIGIEGEMQAASTILIPDVDLSHVEPSLANLLHNADARSGLIVRVPIDARYACLILFYDAQPRSWSLEEQIFARATGNIVGMAMLSHLRQRNFESLDAVLDAILIFDADGLVTYANRAAYDQIGLSPGDLFDEHAMQLLPEMPAPSAGETAHTVPWTRLDGSTTEVRVLHRRLADGGSVATWRDISVELESEKEKETLRMQLTQAAKMEAIGRLAGGMAHDFNNLLGAIMGFAGFLVDDLDEGSEQHGYAMRVLSVSERARQLVMQILAFSRAEGAARMPVGLTEWAREGRDMLQGLLPASTQLIVHPSSRELHVYGNATQLQQVLVNLCVNANDSLPENGGTIEIELAEITPVGSSPLAVSETDGSFHTARLESGQLTIGQRYARLRVRDRGCGIRQDVLDQIFEPFFTTKDRTRGTGLGLAVVHGLLLAHDGAYAVRSTPGDGTVFDVYLPAVDAPAAVATLGTRVAGTPGPAIAALLLDDEEDLLDAMRIGLKRLGFAVAATNSPGQALAWLREKPGAFQVLITDQVMPGMRGTALIPLAKAADPAVRVILTTGYSDGATERIAREAGADAFVLKPVPPETMARTARSLFAA